MSDIKLIKKAKKGHHPSFIALMKEYESTMYRVAKGILKRDHDCADAIQETILICYKKMSSLKEDKYFKTWLIRILINECTSILQKRQSVVPVFDYIQTEEEDLDFKLSVQEAVASLHEALRTVTTLYYFEDLTIKEISHILNIPEGTVKSRLSKARELLMDHLVSESKPSTRGAWK